MLWTETCIFLEAALHSALRSGRLGNSTVAWDALCLSEPAKGTPRERYRSK